MRTHAITSVCSKLMHFPIETTVRCISKVFSRSSAFKRLLSGIVALGVSFTARRELLVACRAHRPGYVHHSAHSAGVCLFKALEYTIYT